MASFCVLGWHPELDLNYLLIRSAMLSTFQSIALFSISRLTMGTPVLSSSHAGSGPFAIFFIPTPVAGWKPKTYPSLLLESVVPPSASLTSCFLASNFPSARLSVCLGLRRSCRSSDSSPHHPLLSRYSDTFLHRSRPQRTLAIF